MIEKNRVNKVFQVLNVIAIIMMVVGFFEMVLIVINLIYGSINPDNSLTKSFLDSYKMESFQVMLPTLLKQLAESIALLAEAVFVFIYTLFAKKDVFGEKTNKWLLVSAIVAVFGLCLVELAIYLLNRHMESSFSTSVVSSIFLVLAICQFVGYFVSQYAQKERGDASEKGD